MTDRAVSRWESGGYAPSPRFVDQLEDVFDAGGSLRDMLGLSGRADGSDRLSQLERRVTAIEAHLGLDADHTPPPLRLASTEGNPPDRPPTTRKRRIDPESP